jgi:predicted small integral membrane protein
MKPMTLRVAKTALVFAVALYTSLIALNNRTDYDSNFQFVRHVLMMDSTFAGNREMWRALNGPAWHILFYWTIILWEVGAAVLCWWGGMRLARACRDAGKFRQAKDISILGLTVSLLLWITAFLIVGGEWFLMWQSTKWNGQETAFRMFAVIGIVLVFLAQGEPEDEAG